MFLTTRFFAPPQNIPTLGTVAITMALHNCDEVAVAGFGYDMNTPHAPLHYYETVKMSAIKEVSAGGGHLRVHRGNRNSLRVWVVVRRSRTFTRAESISKTNPVRIYKIKRVCLIYNILKQHRPFASHSIKARPISALFERSFCEQRHDRSACPSVRRRAQCLRRIKDVTRVNHELSTMITFV